MNLITLIVNDNPVEASVEPRQHLADFLREKMLLTGTHLGCEQGACGACTVLLDGEPVRSCIVYAVSCDAAQVQTIEGLKSDGALHPIQAAFKAEHGLQCGFCTPGMMLTARDIVTRLPDADERRIREELSGNLCRCTGYMGIVGAIAEVLDDARRGK
jgi:carbon-monoxide dehydrogenase small subunit